MSVVDSCVVDNSRAVVIPGNREWLCACCDGNNLHGITKGALDHLIRVKVIDSWWVYTYIINISLGELPQ